MCRRMIMRILLLLCGLPLFAEAAPLEPVASPLAAERSPFLRRFAADPVKWWPWGAEAFQRARAGLVDEGSLAVGNNVYRLTRVYVARA